jgi:hypothetical protein
MPSTSCSNKYFLALYHNFVILSVGGNSSANCYWPVITCLCVREVSVLNLFSKSYFLTEHLWIFVQLLGNIGFSTSNQATTTSVYIIAIMRPFEP